MVRVKSIASRKHKKIKKLAKGYKQSRRQRIKSAKEAILHAGQYAYVGRKLKKRDLRSLWIKRINASVRQHGLSYNQFISKLNSKKIEIDRKILSEIAVKEPHAFEEIVKEVKK